MTLGELIEKLNAFKCDALIDKEVSHCFMSSGTYTYKEDVKDVFYDAKKGIFRIECGEPYQFLYDNSTIIKYNK